MARGPQYSEQIMETQTRFDLTAAIENWRQELAAQPGLVPDARRELETHLRDTVVAFQQRGLTDEEAFLLARRRIGHPEDLREEFVKSNPLAVWRERVMWMASALLIVDLWNETSMVLNWSIVNFFQTNVFTSVQSKALSLLWANHVFSLLFRTVPILGCAMMLVRGGAGRLARFRYIFESRAAFVRVMGGWLFLNTVYWAAWNISVAPARRPYNFNVYANFVYSTIWPIGLIWLIAWLIPSRKRARPVTTQ